MPRQRSPNRDKAFEIWEASGRTVMLKDIAAQLGVSESQIRKWKNQDQWEKVTLPKSKSNVTKRKKGGQPGNKNAIGNKGGNGGPEGNVNAVKHGAYQSLYAAYLPDEEKEIYNQMPGVADLEEEIRLLRLKLARLLSREHDFFYDMFGNKHEKEISEKDREAGINACMKQLEKLVKTQSQIKTEQEQLKKGNAEKKVTVVLSEAVKRFAE